MIKAKWAFALLGILLLVVFVFWKNDGDQVTEEVDIIFTGPYTASVVMPIQITEKYIFQINQLHMVSASDDNDTTTVAHTIETQRNIAALIKEIKKAQGAVLVCPEGVANITEEVRLWDEDANLLNNYKRQVEQALLQNDFMAVKGLYDSVTTDIFSKYTGSERQKQILLAQEVVASAATAMNISIPSQAGIPTHSFGKDVRFVIGGVANLYLEGTLLKSELVACEEEGALMRVGEILSQGEEADPGSEKFTQANKEREGHIVKNATEALKASRSVDNIVVVLGAMHDLTERIENHNRLNGTDFGYIYLLPKPLTKEFLEKLTE